MSYTNKNRFGVEGCALLLLAALFVPPIARWVGGLAGEAKNSQEAIEARHDSVTSEPPAQSIASPSAFERKVFEGVSVSLPRNWRWMGGSDAQALNANSEALTDSLGVGVDQGNNTILVAGNAFNDERVSVATMRLSVRSGSTIGQADLREALKEPQEPISREIREVAEKTATAMRKLPQMQFYNVTGGGLRQNGSMVCMWTAFEYDLGQGATASDSWVCPSADRTFKLTTSYAKSRANLYAATVDYVWRSIRLEPAP